MQEEIWLVDDDPVFRDLVTFLLRREGHEVRVFEDSRSLLESKGQRPALIILDIELPDLSGFEVCKAIRLHPELSAVPVLVATVHPERVNLYRMLELGADDFLPKPIDPVELALRVRNRLARAPGSKLGPAKEPTSGSFQLNHNTHHVAARGDDIPLTHSEYAILAYLAERRGVAVSVETLLVEALGYPPKLGNPDVVRHHIRNLRAKLEERPSDPQQLVTLPRLGYMLKDG